MLTNDTNDYLFNMIFIITFYSKSLEQSLRTINLKQSIIFFSQYTVKFYLKINLELSEI